MQVVNYSHLFPTRYALELESLKGTVGSDTFKEPSQREDAKKTIKKQFEEKYTAGKNKWFFTALRVSAAFRGRFVDDVNRISCSSEWVVVSLCYTFAESQMPNPQFLRVNCCSRVMTFYLSDFTYKSW